MSPIAFGIFWVKSRESLWMLGGITTKRIKLKDEVALDLLDVIDAIDSDTLYDTRLEVRLCYITHDIIEDSIIYAYDSSILLHILHTYLTSRILEDDSTTDLMKHKTASSIAYIVDHIL